MVAHTLPPQLTGRLLPALAVLAGIGVAAGLATAPGATLDAVVARSGLSAILPQAAPPVGVTARTLIALTVGALVVALGLASQWRRTPRAMARRADSHPDAPPCRPLRAQDELGAPIPAPLSEQPLPIAPEPPVPPAIQDVPADLDQPLSAFDPDAIPARPQEPVRAVAPLTRVAKVVPLPPADAGPEEPARITAFSLAPVACAPDAEPRIIAPVVPTPESIGTLVARLEKVARDAARDRRARAERQPSLDDTLARLRQMATG